MNKDNARDYLPLVQALAEGKAIEGYFEFDEKWRELVEVRFDAPASQYRIKHEPREIWVNRHVDGYNSDRAHSSKEHAEDWIQDGWRPVRYREVIE